MGGSAPDARRAVSDVPGRAPNGLRWLAIGGGSVPEHNQVSIEQDVGLAASVLGDGGKVLFAGGPGSSGVQVASNEPPEDVLRLRLARFFDPRNGRRSSYRPITIRVDAPATRETALEELRAGLAGGGAPLLVYIAGHGDMGEVARDNGVALWERSFMSVADVTEVLDEEQVGRAARFVITTCYSGGFGDMIFAGADPQRGVAEGERCGLFASTWDLQASGCDPQPDRSAQEGYGLTFLNALRGLDRDGEPASSLDLDGDGRVSLLEAHTRVRIASPAADVPTTTSERWLRHLDETGRLTVEPGADVVAAIANELVEERTVVQHLARQLGVGDEIDRARERLDDLEARAERAVEDLRAAEDEEAATFLPASATFLARWPVLNDPWHPDFAATLRDHREAITAHFDTSEPVRRHQRAVHEVNRLDAVLLELRRAAAPLERLTRADDSLRLAARARAAGGDAWAVYQRLLACERGVP